MKKIFAFLCAAALVSFVSCDKEKDKEKNPVEEPPTETQFNTGTPVSIPIVEIQQKSGRYDAKIIYNAAFKWHHDGVTSLLYIYGIIGAIQLRKNSRYVETWR